MVRARGTGITFSPRPPYVATFHSNTDTRIHPRGHLWINHDNPPISIPFDLPGGFRFAQRAPNDTDGRTAVSIGDKNNPNPNGFNDFGVFLPWPTLSTDGMTLTLNIKVPDKKFYYYVFNIVGPNGAFSINDPIIVNR